MRKLCRVAGYAIVAVYNHVYFIARRFFPNEYEMSSCLGLIGLFPFGAPLYENPQMPIALKNRISGYLLHPALQRAPGVLESLPFGRA